MPAGRGVVCFLTCLGLSTHTYADEPKRDDVLRAVERQIEAAARIAGPSVACVVVSRSDLYPKQTDPAVPGRLGSFDPKEFVKGDPSLERARLARALDLSDAKTIPDRGYAGGVVIDASGYVLTPYHVIDGATKVYVFLPGGAGTYADIHAADARSDLAVLRLLNPPPKLTSIKFGDVRTFSTRTRPANVTTGKLVVLLANPYSALFPDGQPSASFGSLSNVRHRFSPFQSEFPQPRRIEPRATRYTEYGSLLEYDVKLNAGVTGGALLNLDSEMIGMTNSAALAWGRDVGPGYAVPADENFRRIVDTLRKGEEVEYGFMGVLRLGDDPGSRVVSPMPGGAAARAQMRAGDVVTRINGVPISSFNDLLLHVGSALAGSKVLVTVDRNGIERDLEVTLAKFLNDQPFIASVRPEPVFGLRVDHGSLLAQRLKPETYIAPGVSVREIVPESAAAKQFKTLGEAPPTTWLITHVNGVAVTNPTEFHNAAKGRESLKLTLIDPDAKPPLERELTIP